MIPFAMMKLIGGDNVPVDDSAIFAALGHRLLLEYEPDRQATHVMAAEIQAVLNEEMTQVVSHMRIAYSITRHGEYMRSGTPSEPILVEAAAAILEEEKTTRNYVSFLADKLGPLVSKGERGELATRFLLMKAHHSIIRSMERLPLWTLRYVQPKMPWLIA